ncbi:glycosyltransferase family 4 protein [Aquicella siphonis]|nr:glycosyltransferase family 4 protein [Aquicella siphonis]
MKIAFCLFKYFPYGGLQRDFLRIARLCLERGHEVLVYTMRWEGEPESGLQIRLIEAGGWQNHTRNQAFADAVKSRFEADRPDVVFGFNKMPYLDIYFAADVCYQSRARARHGWLYRLLPRYQRLVTLEKAVFARGMPTEILLISHLQQQEFIRYYQTEAERFHLLPPGIARDRTAPPNAVEIRERVRMTHRLAKDDVLLLMVGSGFKTKGLDRAIRALAFLPGVLKSRSSLFVIGQDNPVPFQRLARRLQVASQVHFLGGRQDVTDFMLAADLLLHPAYHENTGTVLLEALLAGLPVLTTDTCGYAHYITEANAGMVLRSPFEQVELNTLLRKMLLSPQRNEWQQNGLAFAQCADIYSLPEKAVDLIEKIGRKRVSG